MTLTRLAFFKLGLVVVAMLSGCKERVVVPYCEEQPTATAPAAKTVVQARVEAGPEVKPEEQPKCDPEFVGLMVSSNGAGMIYYKCSTDGKFIEDVDAEKQQLVEQHRRFELFNALSTRVLTDEEFEEALSYGDSINIAYGFMTMGDGMREKQDITIAFHRQAAIRAAVRAQAERGPQ